MDAKKRTLKAAPVLGPCFEVSVDSRGLKAEGRRLPWELASSFTSSGCMGVQTQDSTTQPITHVAHREEVRERERG